MKVTSRFGGAWLVTAVVFLFTPVALAQEEGKELGWSDTADFSLVMTSGNSEITTLGFNNLLQRKWEKSLFEFKVGALRAKTTSDLGFADEDGYLSFAGRAKEVINRGGSKIYPKEIESLLASFARVRDVAVVG